MKSRAFSRRVAVLAAVVGLSSTTAFADPITITSFTTADALAQLLVDTSSGITIVPGSATYTGATVAAGSFSGDGGILPFDSGVVLTSGLASLVPGPNNNDGAGFANHTPSNAQLNSLTAPTVMHGDASVLAFSFIPNTSSLSIQFVFGSDEYNEFVGTPFNDVFGFFLNNVNIALVPGTTLPITVNNVNSGTNSQYFTNNPVIQGGTGGIQYDGLVGASVSLFAQGTVIPNAVNTIVLGIEDSGQVRGQPDLLIDSGVLLKAHSFQLDDVPPPTVPEPGTIVLVASGAAFAARRRMRRS